ncbi:hypothetical protein FACS1894211_09130 [Clostridia bacterium]|nr:hypothetical protein FACS1894211_09130 [Clostridia bacterium]
MRTKMKRLNRIKTWICGMIFAVLLLTGLQLFGGSDLFPDLFRGEQKTARAYTAWASGSGTATDPWVITTADHLNALARNVYENADTTANNSANGYAGKYFALGADLDLSAYGTGTNGTTSWTYNGSGAKWGTGWLPIGTSTRAFQGDFDGRGHVITNLYMNRTYLATQEIAGLFGGIAGNCKIRNIGIASGEVRSASHLTGALIGGVRTNIANISVEIENCWNAANIVSAWNRSNTLGNWVGGIVGIFMVYKPTDSMIITGCYNTGDITVVTENIGRDGYVLGGITGGSYSTIAVSPNLNLTITDCYNTGDVTFNADNELCLGGIASFLYQNTQITDCYNTGNLTATNNTELYAGGIFCDMDSGSTVDVKNCYNTGIVSGGTTPDNLGGLTIAIDATVTDSFYLDAAAPLPADATRLTAGQMLTDGNADNTGTGVGTGAMSALFNSVNSLGNAAWYKNTNTAADNYYPELTYFKDFTAPARTGYPAFAAAFETTVKAASLQSVTTEKLRDPFVTIPTAFVNNAVDWTYAPPPTAAKTAAYEPSAFLVANGLVYTGTLADGVTAYGPTATQPVNAGTYTLTATFNWGGVPFSDYFVFDALTPTTATFDFTIKRLKVTAVTFGSGLPTSPTYNATPWAVTNPTLTYATASGNILATGVMTPLPYAISYSNTNGAPASGIYAGNQCVNAGDVTATFTPAGNFEPDTAAVNDVETYTIGRRALGSTAITVKLSGTAVTSLPDVPYNGSPYLLNATDFPGLTLEFTGYGVMTENVDYTLSYSNSNGAPDSGAYTGNPGVNAGTVTVTVTPIGNFQQGSGTKTVTFEITPIEAAPGDIFVAGLPDPTIASYTGSAVTLSGMAVLYVKGGANTQLTENKDYTVSYWDGDAGHPGQAINAGTATITFTLIGNYHNTAPITRQFRISNGSFTKDGVTVTGYQDTPYTGSDVTAGFTLVVKFDGVTVIEYLDYTVDYVGDCVNVGTVTMYIRVQNPPSYENNYTPPDWSDTFQITKVQIDGTTDVAVTGNVPLEYTGAAGGEKYPVGTLVVTFNGITVTEGVDFDIQYASNTAIGNNARFRILPKGNYEAALDLLSQPLYYDGTFTITATALTPADVQIAGYNNMRYTGSAIVFNTLKVYFYGVLAVEGVDYTVSYSDDQGNLTSAIGVSGDNAIGTITITPVPTLYGGGPFTETFVIVGTPIPAQQSDFNVTGMPSPANKTYKGSAWAVSDFANFAVTYTKGFDPAVTLTEGLDYTVSYSNTSGGANNSTNAGTVTVTVRIINQYYSVAPLDLPTFTFVILKADYNMSGVTFASDTVPYDDSAHGLTVSGTLPPNVSVSYEYDGIADTGKTNGGVYAVTAVFSTSDPNYNAPQNMTATLTVTVNVTNIGGTFAVTGVSGDKPYRGTPYTVADFAGFAVTYTYPSSQVVTLLSSDYTVSYSNSSGGAGNSTSVGTVTVTVTVTASYFSGGSPATATFTISNSGYDMSGVTFNNATVTYDGQPHSLTVSGTLPANVTVSYLYDNVPDTGKTAVGTYTVTAVFATSDPNYSAPQSMSATLRIDKATHNMSGVTFANGTFAYDGTVKSLAVSGLPSGVTVSYLYGGVPGTGETAVGTYTVTAVFGVTDTVNYDPPANMTATLTITAGPPNMSGITFPDGTFAYDGTQKSLTVQGTLPAGVSVSYLYDNVPDTGRTAVGTYAVTAVFAVTDPNYTTPADMTATLVIFPQSVVGPPLTTPGGTTPGTPPAPGTPGGPSLPPGTGGSLDGLKPGDKLPDLPDVPPDWKWDGWYDADGNKVTEYPNDGRTLYPTWKWNDSRNAFEKGWEWFTKNVEPYWWFRFPVGFFGALLLGWLFILIPLKRRRDRENER